MTTFISSIIILTRRNLKQDNKNRYLKHSNYDFSTIMAHFYRNASTEKLLTKQFWSSRKEISCSFSKVEQNTMQNKDSFRSDRRIKSFLF